MLNVSTTNSDMLTYDLVHAHSATLQTGEAAFMAHHLADWSLVPGRSASKRLLPGTQSFLQPFCTKERSPFETSSAIQTTIVNNQTHLSKNPAAAAGTGVQTSANAHLALEMGVAMVVNARVPRIVVEVSALLFRIHDGGCARSGDEVKFFWAR